MNSRLNIDQQPESDSRTRLLDSAERIFGERGYASVTMRDIADALGIRQASLYHHMPGGKEQLFIEATERNLARHRAAIVTQLEGARGDLRAQLRAVAMWLVEQPMIDISRLFRADLPAIEPANADRLNRAVYLGLFEPVQQAIEAAYERGEIRSLNGKVTAINFVVLVESLHEVTIHTRVPLAALATDTVDMLLDGMLRR